MNTTMRQLAQALCLPWCIVVAGVFMLVGEAHLSPVIAGQLDALVASTPSLGDGGPLDDLQYPDKILTLVQGSSESTEPVFVSLGLLTGGPVTGELEHGLIYALDPSPEELPDEFAEYQGLLDRMIAVDPRNRFKRADEVLEAIDDVWTQQALRALKRGG